MPHKKQLARKHERLIIASLSTLIKTPSEIMIGFPTKNFISLTLMPCSAELEQF